MSPTYISRSRYIDRKITVKWCKIEIVTKADQYKVVHNLSIGAIFNDLNDFLIQIKILKVTPIFDAEHLSNGGR